MHESDINMILNLNIANDKMSSFPFLTTYSENSEYFSEEKIRWQKNMIDNIINDLINSAAVIRSFAVTSPQGRLEV